MKPIRIGLIGCGWFAQAVHLPILTRLRQVKVVALAEANPERLEVAGRLVPAAARYASYEELIRTADAEAVVVDLPTHLHAEASISAMRQGLHVYLEKPLTSDLDEGLAIVRAWKQTGVIGMIGFNYRRNVLHQSVKACIRSGCLGQLVGVRSVFSAAFRPLPNWKSIRRGGGGALMELGSHHFDLFRFYFEQEAKSVTAELRSVRSEQDTAMVQLVFADDLQVQSFFALNTVDEDQIEVFGSQGKLSLDRYRSIHVKITPSGRSRSLLHPIGQIVKSFSSVPYLYRRLMAPWHEPSYRAALADFCEAVRAKTQTVPDLQDGYCSLEMVCAAEISARTRQPVFMNASKRESWSVKPPDGFPQKTE
jgi:myo-inositol 2-dehydrogenase / D-chiro-inositol 1-dehydrogenase